MKKKRGLCLADGALIPPQNSMTDPRFAASLGRALLSDQPEQPALSQGEEARSHIMDNMNSLGKTDPTPGGGAGASYNWQTKSMQDLAQPKGLQLSTTPTSTIGIRDATANQNRPQRRQLPTLSLAEGGIVRGKGTTTSDDVPMVINGQSVNLSNKEAVLPAKTVHALGGPEAVEQLIEQTNGKPPVKTGLRAGGDYSEGATGGFMRTFNPATDRPYVDFNPAKAPAAEQPLPPVDQNRPWYAGTDSRDERTGLEMERARRAGGPTIEGDPIKQALLTGTLGDGKRGPVTAPSLSAAVAAPASAPAPVSPASLTDARLTAAVAPLAIQAARSAPSRQAGFTAETDATKMDIPEGMGGGVITRAGKNGLHAATLVMGPSAADAARDADFEKAGTKKDAYGNWLTPQRLGDKAQLAQMQADRLERDAFDPSVKDPRVQGLAQAKYAMQQQAAIAAAKAGPSALDIAKFNRETQQQDQTQKNNVRDFDQKTDEAHAKRMEDVLKAKATVDGKLDGGKYAWLQQYAGNFKTKQAKNSDAYFKDLMDNLEVDTAFHADNGNFFRTKPSLGADAVRGVKEVDGMLWGKNYVDPLTKREVSGSDMSKLSPGALEVLKQRMASQQGQK